MTSFFSFMKKKKTPEKVEDLVKIYLDWDFTLYKSIKLMNNTTENEISEIMKGLLKISKQNKEHSLLLVINDHKHKDIISRKINFFEYPLFKLEELNDFTYLETTLVYINESKYPMIEKKKLLNVNKKSNFINNFISGFL